MEPAPSPPGSTEQPFEVDELFFSATDRKGIITSGNSVFVRVSGYGRDELVGRAHNLVRHPDMPRAVFQVLWDYLEAGRPIAAYVKNLAKNGNPYWVVATVAPTEDGGYLSVRIKPTAGIRDIIEPLYAPVRAHEHTLEAAGTPRKEVVAAGVDMLVDLIGKAGFASYDELMRHFLPAELAHRDSALGYGVAGGLSGIGGDWLALKRALDRVFAQLDRYSELERGLDGKATTAACSRRSRCRCGARRARPKRPSRPPRMPSSRPERPPVTSASTSAWRRFRPRWPSLSSTSSRGAGVMRTPRPTSVCSSRHRPGARPPSTSSSRPRGT